MQNRVDLAFTCLVPLSILGCAHPTITPRRDLWSTPPERRLEFKDDAGRVIVVGASAVGIAPRLESGLEVFGGPRYGYVDSSRSICIECQYDDAFNFCEGAAPTRIHDRWHFVDHWNTPQFAYDADWVWFFSEGLATVLRDGKYGYIDRTGNTVIPTQFEGGFPFGDGLAPVKLNGLWGYVDRRGIFVIEPKYAAALPFREGIAGVQIQDKWCFIRLNGEECVSPRYDKVGIASEGLIAVAERQRWGYVDYSGRFVVKPQFQEALPFRTGYAVVVKDKQICLVDRRGTIWRQNTPDPIEVDRPSTDQVNHSN